MDDLCTHLVQDDYEAFAAGRRQTSFFDRYGIDYASIDVANAQTLDRLPHEDVFCVVMFPSRFEPHSVGRRRYA